MGVNKMEITTELTDICVNLSLSGIQYETIVRVVGAALARDMPQDEICKILSADDGLAMLGFMNITYNMSCLYAEQEKIFYDLATACTAEQVVLPDMFKQTPTNYERKRLPKWMQRH